MVTVQQIQKGALQFLTNEFVPQYSNINKKVCLGGTGTLFIKAIPNVIEKYRPVLEAADLMKNNLLDIDSVCEAYFPFMGEEKMEFVLPVLGPLVVTRHDFELLIRRIKEA